MATTAPTTPLEGLQKPVEDEKAALQIEPHSNGSTELSKKAPQQSPTLADPSTENIVQVPFESPYPTSKPAPITPLTTDQSTKYALLLQTVTSWTTIPTTSAKNSPVTPLTDSERQWLTRECLLRYLRATKWSVPDSATRLLGTLAWRREYGVEKHTPDFISPENETGKQVILGYDIAARPCLYLNPARQNTKRSDRQIQHLVFMLERTIDLMGPGQETLSLLINFKDSSAGGNASVGQGRQTLNILQMHYPERLGRALVLNVPWFMTAFFRVISPFIDPITRDKLKFNEDMRQHVPPEQLLSNNGGDVKFEYDHKVYWPALNGLAEQRRSEQLERWVKGGKRIGESEGYLKGGEEMSLKEEEEEHIGRSVDGEEKVDGVVGAPLEAKDAVETT